VRHVVIDPQNPDFLYASLNIPGDVVKINRLTGRILAEVHTGSDCRSLAISTDGTALYVVNYLSNTVTELAASNLKILQVVPTGTNPVGVTYDGTTGRVWVAVYTGEILVFTPSRSRRIVRRQRRHGSPSAHKEVAVKRLAVALVAALVVALVPTLASATQAASSTPSCTRLVVGTTTVEGADGAGYLTILFANAGVTCELSGYPSVQFFVPTPRVCVVTTSIAPRWSSWNSHHAGSSSSTVRSRRSA